MKNSEIPSQEIISNYEDLVSPVRLRTYRWFEARYDVLTQASLNHETKRHYFGRGEQKACRYCKRTEPDTTFRTTAHALPEQIGNKALIDLLECDQCNRHFSKHVDDHLAKWTQPFRVVGRVRGKNGVPKYKSNDGTITIQRGKKSDLHFYLGSDEHAHNFDKEAKLLSVDVERQPYIPRAVFKSLAKMALAVMPPEERENWDAYRRWLLEANHEHTVFSPLIVITQFIPGPVPPDFIAYQLLKRREGISGCAQLIFSVEFANLLLQIDLLRPEPDFVHQGSASAQFTFSNAPVPTLWALAEREKKYGPIDVRHLDMTSNELQRKDIEKLRIHYREASGPLTPEELDS